MFANSTCRSLLFGGVAFSCQCVQDRSSCLFLHNTQRHRPSPSVEVHMANHQTSIHQPTVKQNKRLNDKHHGERKNQNHSNQDSTQREARSSSEAGTKPVKTKKQTQRANQQRPFCKTGLLAEPPRVGLHSSTKQEHTIPVALFLPLARMCFRTTTRCLWLVLVVSTAFLRDKPASACLLHLVKHEEERPEASWSC